MHNSFPHISRQVLILLHKMTEHLFFGKNFGSYPKNMIEILISEGPLKGLDYKYLSLPQ